MSEIKPSIFETPEGLHSRLNDVYSEYELSPDGKSIASVQIEGRVFKQGQEVRVTDECFSHYHGMYSRSGKILGFAMYAAVNCIQIEVNEGKFFVSPKDII